MICTDVAHLHVDECGAPERVAGIKLLTVAPPDGKLHPGVVAELTPVGDQHAAAAGRLHHPVDRARHRLLGRRDRGLVEIAHAHGMLVHVDGARLANAAASLGLPCAR